MRNTLCDGGRDRHLAVHVSIPLPSEYCVRIALKRDPPRRPCRQPQLPKHVSCLRHSESYFVFATYNPQVATLAHASE